MTHTTNTAPAQPNEAGVLEHLDPTDLVIETNVRTEGLALEAEFVDSVRTHGVLVPVLGWRDTDGMVHVRAGQRRTLAAREAAIATIPVYVVRADDDSTARRIVEQLVENEHRQHLTDFDRVAAWRQLTLEGLAVATITKRSGTKRYQARPGRRWTDRLDQPDRIDGAGRRDAAPSAARQRRARVCIHSANALPAQCLGGPVVAYVVRVEGSGEGFRASCPVLACHLRDAASEPPSLSRKALLTEGGSEVQVAGQDRAGE